jgi:hypothetical protein
VQSASGETKLQFRIGGDIDPKAIRSQRERHVPKMGRWKEQTFDQLLAQRGYRS